MKKCIAPYIEEQLIRHPCMQPGDILKLCYQAAYGADHLLTDLVKAEAYFDQEFEAAAPDDAPLYELISPDMARINLRAWKKAGLPGAWLFRLFTLSSKMPVRGDVLTYLEEAEILNISDFHAARIEYEQKGCPSVHHSDIYRQTELPSYRVIHRRLLRLIPILKRAALVKGNAPYILAVDGRAASGKSTIAAQLAYVLDGSLVHMDDFFLPPEFRTQARLEAPGGNVHYERFQEEVIPFLRGSAFSYRRFECSRMAYGDRVTVPERPWRIVEGSYSLHPTFGTYYDISVFSSVSPEEQLRRIEVRNGAAMLTMFQEKWIPMEERYFTTFDVAGTAMVCC